MSPHTQLDAYERRASAADARMQRVEQLLTDIRLEMENIEGIASVVTAIVPS